MKKTKRLISMLVAAVMLITALPMNAFAAVDLSDPNQIIDAQVTVQYGQTEARKMLEYINGFRTGNGQGNHEQHPHQALDADNTSWTDYGPLQPLKYDYELEKVAMQRAAEIALSFSHTRPNGERCFTAYPPEQKYQGKAENIAAGYGDSWNTFIQWREDDRPYSGQGHRRNMLGKEFRSVGVGHVEYNGQHYWVQEFSTKSPQDIQIDPNDASTPVSVQIKAEQIKAGSAAVKIQNDPVQVTVGNAAEAPKAEFSFALQNIWPSYSKCSAVIQPEWALADTAIAKYEHGKIFGLKPGSTSITATVCGEVLTLPVNVICEHQKDADWSKDAENHWHTCVLCGEALDKAPHQFGAWTETKPAACTEAGTRTRTCSDCGYTQTETIPATGHKLTAHPANAADCTHSGTVEYWSCDKCGAEFADANGTTPLTDKTSPALGHKMIHYARVPATCTQDGTVEYWHCERCGKDFADETGKTPLTNLVEKATGHSFGEWTVTKEATCTEQGEQTRTCKVCNAAETQEIPLKPHTMKPEWEKNETSHWHSCTVCHMQQDVAEHGFSEWNIIRDSTETETGLKERSCTVCGYKEQQEIPLKEHVHRFGDWMHNETHHWKECACGEKAETAAHSYKETITTPAGCTTEGVKTFTCTVCGYSYTETIPATGHSFGEWKVTTAPACEKQGTETCTCAACGATKTRPIPALQHSYERAVTTEPTCTAEGVATFTCAYCGKQYTESIPALGHQMTRHPAVNATCTTEGNPEYWTCERCSKTFADAKGENELGSDQLILPALGHKLTHHARVPATCEKDGTVEYWNCEQCGKNFAEEAANTVLTDLVEKATGHSFGEWKVTTEPTCTAKGAETRTCTVCGKTETREIAALGHNEERVVTTEATCTTDGLVTYTCKRCGEQRTEKIPALGHKLTHHARVPATCEKDGTVEYWSCEQCGKNFAQEAANTVLTDLVEKATGHSFGEWKITTEPTCTAKGAETRTCTVCGKTETREIAALGHKLTHHARVPATCEKDGTVEYWSCEQCGKNFAEEAANTVLTDLVEKATGHSFGEWKVTTEPTCTAKGTETRTCTACGKTETREIAALGHNEERVVTTEATCTTDGLVTYTCKRCGEQRTEKIPALGHKLTHHARVPATCEKDGTVEYWSCEQCGKNFAQEAANTVLTDLVEKATGHSFGEWKITTEPTCTAKGAETRTCTACGKTETREIAALGHKLTHVNAVKPTEQNVGCVEHWHCERCGKNFADAKGMTEILDVTIGRLPAKPNANTPAASAKPAESTFDWQTVRTAIAGINTGSYQKDVGNEIAVPHYVWQAFYGRNVTVTLVRCGDKYVFNGLDLARTGFDPDNGHNLTDLTGYIGRNYTAPAPIAPEIEQEKEEPAETEKPEEPEATATPEPEKTPDKKDEVTSAAEPEKSEQTSTEPAETEKESSGLAWWIWLLIAAAVLLIVWIIILVVKRRRDKEK